MGRIAVTVALSPEAYQVLRQAANLERRPPFSQAEVMLERLLLGGEPKRQAAAKRLDQDGRPVARSH